MMAMLDGVWWNTLLCYDSRFPLNSISILDFFFRFGYFFHSDWFVTNWIEFSLALFALYNAIVEWLISNDCISILFHSTEYSIWKDILLSFLTTSSLLSRFSCYSLLLKFQFFNSIFQSIRFFFRISSANAALKQVKWILGMKILPLGITLNKQKVSRVGEKNRADLLRFYSLESLSRTNELFKFVFEHHFSLKKKTSPFEK